MELEHLMAVPSQEIGKITVGGIGHNEHPRTCRPAPVHGGKEFWTLVDRQEAG